MHGFPSCSLDFIDVWSHLTRAPRVIAFDHLVFGLSDKPHTYAYSLFEQADMALGLWDRLGITRGHLIAHDYSASVAAELIARQTRGLTKVKFLSLTLCNSNIHSEHTQPRLAQRALRQPRARLLIAKLSLRGIFKHHMRHVLAAPDRVSNAMLDALWAALNHNQGHQRLPAITRALDERHRFHHRWVEGLRSFDRPAHILWGRHDPMTLAATAHALAEDMPHAKLTWLDHAGHYPMLERPTAWANAVLDFDALDQA